MAKDAVTVKITGLAELQKALEEVPKEVSKKVLRKSLTAAAKVVREAMVDHAPKDTGFLEDHFNIKFKSHKRDIAASAFIGPDGKAVYPKQLPKGMQGPNAANSRQRTIKVVSVARFLEFGTSKMGAKPFMTQGFENAKDNALEIIIDGIKDALEESTKGKR